jgi:hypothetical protein
MTLRAFRLGKPHPNSSPLTLPVACPQIAEASKSSSIPATNRRCASRPTRTCQTSPAPFGVFDAHRLECAPRSGRSVWIRLAPSTPRDVSGWSRGKEGSNPFDHAPRHLVAFRRPARTATPRPSSLAPPFMADQRSCEGPLARQGRQCEAMRLLEPCNRLSKSSTHWMFGSWWVSRPGPLRAPPFEGQRLYNPTIALVSLPELAPVKTPRTAPELTP